MKWKSWAGARFDGNDRDFILIVIQFLEEIVLFESSFDFENYWDDSMVFPYIYHIQLPYY